MSSVPPKVRSLSLGVTCLVRPHTTIPRGYLQMASLFIHRILWVTSDVLVGNGVLVNTASLKTMVGRSYND